MDSEQGFSQINTVKKAGGNLSAIKAIVTEAGRKTEQEHLTRPRDVNTETSISAALDWFFEDEPELSLEEIAGRETAINPNRLQEVRKQISHQILVGKRGENQRLIEEQLNSTFELPFLERLKLIRPFIFRGITTKYDERYDENINNLRTIELPDNGDFQTVANSAMREIFFPQFQKQIDGLYTEIKVLPTEEQSEAALRFVSYMFATGILLHLYVDGNGQTFKMLILSYLHELGGEKMKGKYFPKKTGGEKSLNDDPLPTRLTVNEDPIYDLGLTSEESKSLGRYKMLKNQLALPTQYRKKKYRNEEELDASFKTEFPNNREKMETAVQRFSAKQKELGLDPFTPTLRKKATAYLDFITNSQEGRSFIREFIVNGSQQQVQENDIFNPYKKRTIQILSGLQGDIKKLPEL
ncbi:MAG TPA: hypothetical protein VLF89_03435 [Candidatus Saccharimonadales bacterium]|nr:hypothetical protein [Candidatus Saccharimonadales bacterium]